MPLPLPSLHLPEPRCPSGATPATTVPIDAGQPAHSPVLTDEVGCAGTRRASRRVERHRRRASRAGTRVRRVPTRRCCRRPARPARRRWCWTPGRRLRRRPRPGRCGGVRVLRVIKPCWCRSPGKRRRQHQRPGRCSGCRVSEGKNPAGGGARGASASSRGRAGVVGVGFWRVFLVPEHPGQKRITGQGPTWAHTELLGHMQSLQANVCYVSLNPLHTSLNPGSGRRARLGRSRRRVRRRSSPWPCRRRMHTMRSRTSRRPSSPLGARRRSSARATMRATRCPHLVCRLYTFSAVSKYLGVGV